MRARRSGVVRSRDGLATAIGLCLVGSVSACVTKDDARKLVEALQASQQSSRPDVAPVMISRDPVRYPPSLYARRAQGNVMLRIFIDSTGTVHPESTRVDQVSGEAAFDSAAIAGVRSLRFTPAKRKGQAVAVWVLFPVFFRHPQGAPIPGDSVLHRAPPGNPAPGGARGDSARR
jgi:TonB family protein